MAFSDMDLGMRKYLLDLTKRQVLTFTNVLRAPSWDYLLINEDDGIGKEVDPRNNKTGAPTDGFIKFLRSSNSNGYNVYARPNSNRHVLIDDVKQPDINRMIADGLRPNVLMETSPNNHHVWFTLAKDEIEEELSVKVQRLLTYRYCGDKRAVGRKRLGRLPAFANRKAIHYDAATNKHPYTKLIKSTPIINAAMVDLLKEAESIILPNVEMVDETTSPSSPKGCAHYETNTFAFDEAASILSEAEAVEFFSSMVEYVETNGIIDSYTQNRSDGDYNIAMSCSPSFEPVYKVQKRCFGRTGNDWNTEAA